MCVIQSWQQPQLAVFQTSILGFAVAHAAKGVLKALVPMAASAAFKNDRFCMLISFEEITIWR
jgi:hypothetical protein